MSEILVKLEVEQGRRMLGVFSVAGLGITLLYIAVTSPPAILPALFALVLVGVLFIWVSFRIYRTTDNALFLTRETITSQSGRILCRVEDIAKIDRGFFAFKPSNGFLIILKERGEPSWAPGMWWQLGKHLGIGGLTSLRQSKEMASAIQSLLAETKKDRL